MPKKRVAKKKPVKKKAAAKKKARGAPTAKPAAPPKAAKPRAKPLTKTTQSLPITIKSTAEIKIPAKTVDQVLGQEKGVEIVKKAARQRRNVFLLGEPGTGKCVAPETLITLAGGEVLPAESVFNRAKTNGIIVTQDSDRTLLSDTGLRTLSINRKNVKLTEEDVLYAARFKNLKQLFRIKTSLGSEVTLTDNHPLLTITKRGELKWVPAKDLSKGGRIASARSVTFPEITDIDFIDDLDGDITLCILDREFGLEEAKKKKVSYDKISHIRYKTSVTDSSSKKVKVVGNWSEELGRFLAYMLSETSITRDRNIIFTNNDKAAVTDFAFLAHSLFGIRFNVAKRKEHWYAQASSSSLCRFLNQVFDVALSSPNRSHITKFPRRMLSAPLPVLAAFIRTYYDMEGHVQKPRRRCMELCSGSKEFTRVMQIALLRFGIISRLKTRYNAATNTKGKKRRKYYYLFIFGAENLRKFRGSIGLHSGRKRERLERSIVIKPNPNLDVVPNIFEDLKFLKEKLEFKNTDVTDYPATFSRYVHGKREPSRRGLADITEKIANVYLSKQKVAGVYDEEVEDTIIKLSCLTDSDIYWDKIESITKTKSSDYVYDFTVPTNHSFLAGNILLHNSMLGLAMAELLPVSKLQDVLVYPNLGDPNQPKIKTVKAGKGLKIVEEETKKAMEGGSSKQMAGFIAFLFLLSIPWVLLWLGWLSELLAAACLIVAGMLGIGVVIGMQMRPRTDNTAPKLLVDNSRQKHAPFIEATGAKAGALLGDVKHDPLQSGGLGTPAHLRVIAGMIHRSHLGVLFIDEIGTLSAKSQQELLTAMQERKFSITGQSEMSSGAMVHTSPAPCNFVLVAAGNLLDLKNMHPALRSRIRGYGYEIYLNEKMPDTPENRVKIAQFIAQEVQKDGKIPHFSRAGVEAVIREAQKRAGRKGKLTVKLRELGGLVRAAGDIARADGSALVEPKHIKAAKKLARTMEQQLADQYISQKKEYEVFSTSGKKVGKVNGLAIMGDGGIVLPIEAEVAPAHSKSEGKLIATGKLGEIAREAVTNVSAIVKKYKGTDISRRDIHVQFLQTYEGVEGDSASVSVATALISALEELPVDQSIAMTGSLSVRGEVLPVGGITPKIEAAIGAGMKTVIIPEANRDDILLSPEDSKKIRIITAANLYDVLSSVLASSKKKPALLKKIKRIVSR